jgi:uncharacterized membrane protein
MRKSLFMMVSILCCCLAAIAQAQQNSGDKTLVGAWAGAWTGGSNGTFEMTVTKEADGKLGGKITPKREGGESYTVPFNSVAMAESKVTLKLSDPNGEADITLELTLEGSAMKGKYSVRIKADGNEVESGAITANKKP